ncbi:MAG: SpoIIE family protein phosphatase [Thermodesulfobacteriota bacterium]|nr:SpoIIE family protein phosphatase [Thermodesulfobacteriota bacterium]
MKILIAEDDPVSMKLLQRTIVKWEHEVYTAEDGLKAWKMFQDVEFDIVITDWMMPGIYGTELCRKIREYANERYIYTIIVTSKEEIADLVEGFEAGADDFLTKPFNKEELKSRIDVGIRILELENRLRNKNNLLEEANNKIIKDLEYAARIQQSLLPNNLPNINGIEMCWKFFPCTQLGGDMLNVLRLDENHYGIYMLDVSGHGAPSALFSVALSYLLTERREILKTYTTHPPYYVLTSPKDVLESLNHQFPMDLHAGQYFTILYGILDSLKLTFHWSNAGHPSLIAINEEGVKLFTEVGGPPIGFFKDSRYSEGFVKLKPKEKIILYSDGILEALNQANQQFTIDRIIRILKEEKTLKLKEIFPKLISEVQKWTSAKCGPNDDISLLGLEILET